MARSINGIGTILYGRANKAPDGSYVATKWITFFWIPLIPLGSQRVWNESFKFHAWGNRSVTEYRYVKVPLHRPHLLKAYAITVFIGLMIHFYG